MDNYYGNICYCRRCNGVVHTIKKGDTLYLISKYYKVPIGEIMGANRNINVYNLQIGDEICIPVRRPEPREIDVNNNGIDNMNSSMGNTMNNNISNMGDIMPDELSGMTSNMISYENMAGQSDAMMGSIADYTNGNEVNSEVSNVTESSVAAASSQISDINKLKVSELIGENDMTVEELAKLLKKYM